MCGFAGFVSLGYPPGEVPSLVSRMLRSIAHRGRDEMGYYIDDEAVLATVRLAVIDPAYGKQPMPTPDGRYWVALNGEIFNYIELRSEMRALGVEFRTKSDTEVLCQALATWGLEAVPRLNGQFGFVFYDSLSGEVMLGRDPFGERPVFYTRHGGGIAFASEIKGIFALPNIERRLSIDGLREAYRFWAPLVPKTAFEGIESLPPGHVAVFHRDRGLKVDPYYRLPPPGECDISFGEAQERLRDLLEASVELRLRSDFEVGAFMSGGLDSAAIASVMRAKSPGRLRTFSVTVDDPRFDESKHQDTVSRWLHTDHVAVRVTGSDVRSLFPTVVYQSEAPLVRTIAVASSVLARSVQEAGVRVVLSGEGADELLLGYDVAKEAAFLEKWSSLSSRQERLNWIQGLFHDAVISKPFDADRVVDFYEAVAGSPEMALGAHLRRFSMEPDFATVGRDASDGHIWTRDVLDHLRVLDPSFDERRLVERAQVIDFVTLLSGYGLACQADRPGVVHSVESRFPYLDPALARFAWSLPVDFRLLSGRREKHILREAFSGALPPETTRRRKQAMRVPGAEVLKREGGEDWVADLISDGQLRRSSVVDPVSSRRLIDRVHATDGRVPYPDNHAYCLLLSTLLLEDHYVHRFTPPQEDVDTPLVRRVDRRRLRAG